MNFFKLYIGDYQRDTAHLTISEHGAYMLMLQTYYATEKPLPNGKTLHRMLRAESKIDRDAIDSIVRQFWTITDDGLVNQRANEEIKRASHQRTVNREVGKLGGRRKATESLTESVQIRHPNDNPNQTPDTRQYSEPNGSGEELATMIFRQGVQILRGGGASDSGARSLLGKGRKAVGDDKVAEIIAWIATQKPPLTDPAAYFAKAIQPKVRSFVV